MVEALQAVPRAGAGGAPPRRRGRAGRGDAGLAIGCCAALLLHGALLVAVILEAPMPFPPPQGRPMVSLLVQPAAKPSPPVRPRPAAMPERPGAAPVIAAAPSAPDAAIPRAARPAAHPPAVHAQAVQAGKSAGFPGIASPAPALQAMPEAKPQGFVAAEPLPGAVNQPPEYPPEAIAHGEQGRVLLSIHVLPDGRADFVSVTQSSGYQVLDAAAQDAVLRWRFQPARLAGKPVVQVIPFWINFDLATQSARGQ